MEEHCGFVEGNKKKCEFAENNRARIIVTQISIFASFTTQRLSTVQHVNVIEMVSHNHPSISAWHMMKVINVGLRFF